MFDLGAATTQLGALVRNVTDDQLGAPTPCPDYTVGDLLDHVAGLSMAFAFAARKEDVPGDGSGPSGDAGRLADDFRTTIPRALDELAAAWRDAAAWEGTATAGGVTMPGDVTALVALDECVLHGWDIAVSTGQTFGATDEDAARVHEFVSQFATSDGPDDGNGLFGPAVAVADDAPILDRVLGMAGRDPAWRPPA